VNAAHDSDWVKYCRLDGFALQRVLEFQTFNFPLIDIAARDLPASPGSVQRDASGRATLLHFAPGRMLAPTPASEVLLDRLQAARVGSLFEVDGKWQAFTMSGPGAERVLSSTINLTQVLGQRDCAALHLFDCPAIIARRPGAFDVWVEASYASAFREQVNLSANALERR
jgi:hypothetical protein